MAAHFFFFFFFRRGGRFPRHYGRGAQLLWPLAILIVSPNNQNKHPDPQARDYAYRGVSAMMRFDQSFSPRLSGNIAYNFGFNYYLYPDLYYRFISGADKNRITTLHSITFSLGYDLNDRIRAYAGGVFQIADSNLPVGFVLTTEDVIGVGRALGDYKKISLTAGMTLNF